MTSYQMFAHAVCFAFLVLLTAFSVTLVILFYKMQVDLIHRGAEDESILREYARRRERSWTLEKVVTTFTSLLLALAFFVLFVLTLRIKVLQNRGESVGAPMVVKSSSMAEKHESNDYLTENHLDDQFDTLDLIWIEKLPDEFDLKLYDIVVYHHEDTLIIHRIVAIEEPNGEHPGHRHFTTQGDAVRRPDNVAVTYDKMLGIYRGRHLPFAGTVVEFFQSPVGWACLVVILLYVVGTPIVERNVLFQRKVRLEKILGKPWLLDDERVTRELAESMQKKKELKKRKR